MLLQPCNTGCCNLATQASNPIGLKRKEHKYGVLLGRIINLPKHIRDAFNGLLLLGLYSMKHAKDYGGVTRMIAGVHQETGEVFDEISFVAEMNALLQGVDAEIPDDINGGMMPITLEVVFLGHCADLLGCAGVGPWPECFRAIHPCLDCWWHSKCSCAYVPADSTESRRKGAHEADCKGCAPRTDEDTRKLLQQGAATSFSSKAARTKFLREGGIGKFYSALQYIPGASLATDARKDTMHLFLRGISAHEALWMIDSFVKMGEFSWKELNEERRKLTLPKGHKIPELYEPKSDGKALSAKSLLLNGSGILHFVVNR